MMVSAIFNGPSSSKRYMMMRKFTEKLFAELEEELSVMLT
jgi:hypothetical protein